MNATTTEFLAGSLFEKKEPVTFRSLSRALSIHHSVAKKLLFEFFQQHHDKLNASFVITGVDDSGLAIKVVPEQDVQTNIEALKEIHTVHVFGVTSKEIGNVDVTKFVVHDQKISLDYSKLTEYFRNGLLQGPKLVVAKTSRPVSANPVKKSEPLSTKSSSSSTPVPETKSKTINSGLSSGYVSRKGATEKKPSAGISSLYTSRKGEAKKSSPAPASTGYQYKSRKAELNQPKERVIVSQAGIEEPDEEVVKPTKTNVTDIQKLFEDDDSDFSDDTEIKDEPIVVEEKPIETNTILDDVSTKENESKIEPNESIEEISNPTETKTSRTESPEPEQESYVDEDGYLVTVNKTKKVTPTQQSHSSRLKRPASTTNTVSKNDPKKKKTGQSSLMSFFKPN